MTIVVSHAMRRYSPPSPSGNYFVHRVGEESPCHSSSRCEEHHSARSMRLTEPWMYGSLRSPPAGFFLTPALVLCTCPEYINGTKRSSKKGPTICKKCKGTRLPLHMVEPPPCNSSVAKYGTVRCYPATPVPLTGSVSLRAGTARVSSNSRPSILPSVSDPYDFLRRSRTSTSDYNAGLGKRSKSPNKCLRNDTYSMRQGNSSSNKNKFGTAGRKSILECEINPYDLVEGDEGEKREKDVTLLNGQRIRVRPPLPEHEYEDVDDIENENRKKLSTAEDRNSSRRSSRHTKQLKNEVTTLTSSTVNTTTGTNGSLSSISKGTSKQHQQEVRPSSPVSVSPSSPPKVGGDTYKSILKKTTAFLDGDTLESGGRPFTHRRSRSSYYLTTTVRKKVQFSDENQTVSRQPKDNYERLCRNNHPRRGGSFDGTYDTQGTSSSEEIEEDVSKPNRIQRSISERFENQNSKVKFNDTMALRTKTRRKCGSNNFSTVLVSPTVDISLIKSFTKNLSPRPPPPLPPPKIEEVEEEEQNEKIDETKTTENLAPVEEEISNDNEKIYETFGEAGKIDEIEKCHFDKGKEEETEVVNDDVRDTKEPFLPPTAPPRRKNNKIGVLNVINEVPSETTVDEIGKELTDNTTTNNTVPEVLIKTTGSPVLGSQNKTIVQIRSVPDVHKIQIKNDYPQISNISIVEHGQRKTSIMINGDDCYSTVNVSDDMPIYLSSVVLRDANSEIIHTSTSDYTEKSQTFATNISSDHQELKNVVNVNTFSSTPQQETLPETIADPMVEEYGSFVTKESKQNTENETKPEIPNREPLPPIEEEEVKEDLEEIQEQFEPCNDTGGTEYQPLDYIGEEERSLKEILRNPVEAVRLNLVPHVCGKSDMARRPPRCSSFTEFSSKSFENKRDYETPNSNRTTFTEISANSASRQDSSIISTDTGNSSMHYETMEQESDFYTDNSNRSSVAEDDSTIRSKFYELLADSVVTELSENDDHQYESIKNNVDPIYEEIEIPPPLPTSPPPKDIIDDLQLDKQITTRSIFEGASKYDILSYLVDAKERGLVPEDSYAFGNSEVVIEEETLKETGTPFTRGLHMSTISDSSEESSLIMPCTFSDEKTSYQKSAEVERNDSGVGSETSKASLTKYRNKIESSSNCEDCELPVDIASDSEALLCRKCIKRRSERKEIITEIVETEEKYSRDLQIILEEFYQPMLVAGLLTQEQLSAIFLNVEELLENSQALAERLRDAVEIATEQGDEDLLTVNIGKLFLEATPMLHAFETYCVRQAGASLLLASLEKDKELLRIFLRVSQMENTMLRRMNLNSFLMVPVQRVTKYPLLLARLYKATPAQHETREQLMEAKHQIELHLNHMNSETKDVPSKLWRRIGSSSGRRLSTEMDLVSIKLRKIAVDVLEWNHEEAKFALEGKLFFTQPTDNNWRKGRTIKLTPVNALLVTNGKNLSGSRPERLEDDGLRFPKGSGIREAALLLVRDKNGRYSLLRDPLYLDRCVIATDPAWHSYFEVQEVIGKDTFIFKAEDEEMTQTWYRELQYHAQGLGIWRKRRNALANIMINGMGLRT